MENEENKTKRIAKNTLMLYFRMMFLMVISLYTSRVVLNTLGVEDFGVYNVIGGFVALFAILSKSMSSAISRFFNYTMGQKNAARLAMVFSASVTIEIGLAIVIAILCEIVGIWFITEKMVLAPDRIPAALWVLHFSIATFCMTLISVPYNAAIIAHERMRAFAYISVYEGLVKLGISFLIMISPIDRLVFYSGLICCLQISVRYLYQRYCRKNFEECKFSIHFEKKLFREIASFAIWNFIGSASGILRNHGGNVLVNLFFGPVANAARGVANQVLHAIEGFANNFMTAVKPQIQKSFASGDRTYMMFLIFKSARLSYYMILLLSLPVLIKTDFVLNLWLVNPPSHAVSFVRLTLIFSMIEAFSHPLETAQQATGKVKKYQMIVGGIQLLNIPVSYLLYKMGGPAETFLIVAIGCGLCCLTARLIYLHYSVKLDSLLFLRKVIFNVTLVSLMSASVPSIVAFYLPNTFASFAIVTIISLALTALVIYFIGCDSEERHFIVNHARKFKAKFSKKEK